MNEIRFKRDTAFRKQFFVPDSFAHPAKMDAQLLIWLVERFTSVGETILDPMSGSGTLMLACGLGRNVVMVELEEKFVKMQRDNWEKVRQRPQLGYPMGTCQMLQGDARNLMGLLVDKVISSPPYALTVQKGHEGVQSWKVIEGLKNADNKTLRQKSKELAEQGKIINQYGEDRKNIGNLSYGDIDKIVTSPPYEGIEARDRSKEAWWDEERENKLAGGSAKIAKGYQVDKVVTSPPYEGQMDGGSRHTKGGIPKRDKKMKRLGSYITDNKSNIGNMYKDSYLSAMLQVYQQCHTVLKPGGLMILVTKNFIRNKAQVRLDEDTIKICEKAGFKYLERYYRKLSAQSFWRIIYHQKFPDVKPIEYEDVLVFGK